MSFRALSHAAVVSAGAAPGLRRRSLVGATLILWHLLSLDAPTVATVWTLFAAWCAGIHLPWTAPAAMFLAVWELYAADRLLDANPFSAPPQLRELESRHLFHHKHRRSFLRLMFGCAVPLLALVAGMTAREGHLYLLLGYLLAGWLLLVHLQPSSGPLPRRLPKEFAVGVFFSAAVFIPTVARLASGQHTLGCVALCFGLLCALNCLFLHRWEKGAQSPAATAVTRWAVRHLRLLAAAFVLCSLTLGAAVPTVARVLQASTSGNLAHAQAPFFACALSAGLLLTLEACQPRLEPLVLRAAADLVLLTPLLVMAATLLRFHA